CDPSVIPLAVDPTNGKFINATRVVCKPMHWVENNTLLMIEAGVQRLSFDLTRNHNNESSGNSSKVLICVNLDFRDFENLLFFFGLNCWRNICDTKSPQEKLGGPASQRTDFEDSILQPHTVDADMETDLS
ncbi:11043_t:CDS:1, partial [Acaulospora colombiana]